MGGICVPEMAHFLTSDEVRLELCCIVTDTGGWAASLWTHPRGCTHRSLQSGPHRAARGTLSEKESNDNLSVPNSPLTSHHTKNGSQRPDLSLPGPDIAIPESLHSVSCLILHSGPLKDHFLKVVFPDSCSVFTALLAMLCWC